MASDLLREYGDTAGVPIPKSFIFDFGEDVTYVKTNKVYVVVGKEAADWIVWDESPENEQNPAAYYLLPPTAVNRIEGQRELAVQDKISIHSKTAISYDHVDPKTLSSLHAVCKPANMIKIYSATLEPLVAVKNEIVAVHQINRRQITIIGNSFEEPTVLWYPEDEQFVPFKEGDFVQVGCAPLESGVTMDSVSNRLRGTGGFSGKQVLDFWDFKFYIKRFKNNAVEANEETENIRYFPIDVKPITPTELDYIDTRLQSKEEISYEDAVRYIKEPAIAAFMLENVFEEDAREAVTIRTNPEFMLNENKTLHFVLNLNVDQRELLVETKSRYQWREGMELMVSHSKLKVGLKKITGFMTIAEIKTNSTGGSRVILIGCNRSEKTMRVIIENKKVFADTDYKFSIGPQNMHRMTAKMIKQRFANFYEKKNLFMAYCGHSIAPKVELKDKNEFLVSGRPLDPSQLEFMKTAAISPGWTCAQAPPGCGKTHTTSALVAYLYEMAKQGEAIRGVVISGTTNAAVTNAADAVKANFEGINIIRDFSLKAESEAREKSLKHSLTKMARNAKDHLNLDENPLVEEMLNRLEIKEQCWEGGPKLVSKADKKSGRRAQERMIQMSAIQQAERKLKQTFLEHYDIQVYATTAELLVRKGNEESIFGGGETEEDEEQLNQTIERIILDESAQLNPIEALAIYCTFPNLKYITLLGDIFQLGPHSRLDPKSQVHGFITVGELNRMINLKSATRCNLKRIYRCHPTITEVFLKPIYGDEIEVATKPEDRDLAEKHNIFRAYDGSPFALIDLVSEEMQNTNATEMNTVMSLINHLIFQKQVSRDDIVILTYHRAQKDYIADNLKNKTLFGSTETVVPVYTVDSFQGKEAKIIILCTTKTSNGIAGEMQSKLKFVGNPKRATVAVSRAQHFMYVLGEWPLLVKSAFWKKIIIEAVKGHGPFLNGFFDQRTDATMRKIGNRLENKTKSVQKIEQAQLPTVVKEFNPTHVIDEEQIQRQRAHLLQISGKSNSTDATTSGFKLKPIRRNNKPPIASSSSEMKSSEVKKEDDTVASAASNTNQEETVAPKTDEVVKKEEDTAVPANSSEGVESQEATEAKKKVKIPKKKTEIQGGGTTSEEKKKKKIKKPKEETQEGEKKKKVKKPKSPTVADKSGVLEAALQDLMNI